MNEVKPRVKDKETRIEEIQNAARKVFFEKGYQSSNLANQSAAFSGCRT